MPVSYTLHTKGTDTTNKANGQSYASASISPAGNKLNIVLFLAQVATPVDGSVTVSGNGITWTLIRSIPFGVSSDNGVWAFFGSAASPSAGTLTFTNADADTMGQGQWIVLEFDGVDMSGGAAAAIVQSAENAAADDSGTAVSVTLGAFGSANNATLGFIGAKAPTSITQGSGFTEVDEQSTAEGNTFTQAQFRADNDTSVDWTLGSATHNGAGMLAIEIKGQAAATAKPFYVMLLP